MPPERKCLLGLYVCQNIFHNKVINEKRNNKNIQLIQKKVIGERKEHINTKTYKEINLALKYIASNIKY